MLLPGPGREHGRELTPGFNLPSSARPGALSAAPGPSGSVMQDFHGSPLGQGKPNGSLCLFLLLLPCPAASRRTDVLSNRSLRSCSLIVSCRTKIAAWEGAEELKTFHSLVPPAQRRGIRGHGAPRGVVCSSDAIHSYNAIKSTGSPSK